MENNFILVSDTIKNLMYSFTKIRLNKERSYYIGKTRQTAPKNTISTDTFFTKLKKGTSNFLNSGTYNKYVDKRNKIDDYIKKYDDENYNLIEYNDSEIRQKVREVFVNDKYGLAKLEFIMNFVTNDSYEYETNSESFSEISQLLDLEYDYVMNIYNLMKKVYSEISINKRSINTKALAIASLITIPLIISGVGAIIGGYAVAGSVTTAGLAGAGLGLGMAEGVAVLCLASAVGFGLTYGLTYKGLELNKKIKLKQEFAGLSIEQTTMSLVKTMISMLHLHDFSDSEAKELYNSYVEEYIDLKSDCDVRLFLKEEKVLENKDKNSIFANADIYLKKHLFSV